MLSLCWDRVGDSGGGFAAISGVSARTAPPRIYVTGSPAGTRLPTTLRRGTKTATRVLAGAPRGAHAREDPRPVRRHGRGTKVGPGTGGRCRRRSTRSRAGGLSPAPPPVAGPPQWTGLRGGYARPARGLGGGTDKCRVSISPALSPPPSNSGSPSLSGPQATAGRAGGRRRGTGLDRQERGPFWDLCGVPAGLGDLPRWDLS